MEPLKRTFQNLEGEYMNLQFKHHPIDNYELLFHVSSKDSLESIQEHGLQLNRPMRKSMVKTDLLFFSYPIDMNTSDCFRWYDESCVLIILDAAMLREDGFNFYDDIFGAQDQSSKRNHLVCDQPIPAKYIKQIFQV